VTGSEPRKERVDRLFNLTNQVRQFEIERFWQRSIYFWGFVAAAIIALGEKGFSQDLHLRLALGCFGTISSFAWTLQNRGNKYWQKAWEDKLKRYEIDALGESIFNRTEIIAGEWPWGALRYSPSKLTIALSDCTFILFAFFTIRALNIHIQWSIDFSSALILGFTIGYIGLIFFKTKGGTSP
jgi:hypothetical protein